MGLPRRGKGIPDRMEERAMKAEPRWQDDPDRGRSKRVHSEPYRVAD